MTDECICTTGILSFCPILLVPPITVYFIVHTSCFIVTRSKEMYLLIRGCAEGGFLFEDLEEKINVVKILEGEKCLDFSEAKLRHYFASITF